MTKKLILLAALTIGVFCRAEAQNEQKTNSDTYTIIANPAQNSQSQIRINWHTDQDVKKSFCTYTKVSDTKWKKAKIVKAQMELCTVFDSIYSKKANGENFYEDARFNRCTVELSALEPATEYMYRVGGKDKSEVHYFKTAPTSGQWTAGLISDYHFYPPIPKRMVAAMDMIKTLEDRNGKNFDIMLHTGDVCAWGGSYSFWKQMYEHPYFSKYVWAGVNGNHDDMSRDYSKQTNQYTKSVNNYPVNGYEGEEGVCYFFKYDNALFIALNSENMRKEEDLAKAQKWVKSVIAANPAKYVIVMEHYQWFMGNEGKISQYARWKDLFDECGVDLALSGNNHIYVRTNALYQGKQTDGSKGTVYVQTPSADNERGQILKEWTDNKDLIKFRWTEGESTIGGIVLKADDKKLSLYLYDRSGELIDSVQVLAKR